MDNKNNHELDLTQYIGVDSLQSCYDAFAKKLKEGLNMPNYSANKAIFKIHGIPVKPASTVSYEYVPFEANKRYIKNGQNLTCYFCNQPTVTLFHLDRYCPKCQK